VERHPQNGRKEGEKKKGESRSEGLFYLQADWNATESLGGEKKVGLQNAANEGGGRGESRSLLAGDAGGRRDGLRQPPWKGRKKRREDRWTTKKGKTVGMSISTF